MATKSTYESILNPKQIAVPGGKFLKEIKGPRVPNTPKVKFSIFKNLIKGK